MLRLENILNAINKSIPDYQLSARAKIFDELANDQPAWHDAIDYLRVSKKEYSQLKEGRTEQLLAHARYAESLTFPRINNFELEEQLNYSRKIYESEKSVKDLYNLALHAESAAHGFGSDTHQIQFLEYARKIFLKLDKKEDLDRLAKKAVRQSTTFGNPVSESRFLRFAITTFRGIGRSRPAEILKVRADAVDGFLAYKELIGEEPQYTRR
jgi:hypothetical protein